VKDYVWCMEGMAHFGRLVASVLEWDLLIDTPVPDCDTVFIVGLYDPPHYSHTLDMTKRAKRRVIQFCGSDVLFLSKPAMLPDATFTCDGDALKDELWSKGIDATVCTLPTTVHPTVTPYPEKPCVAVYFGGNATRYGSQQVAALQDVFPDVEWLTYPFGEYTAEQMPDVIARATVYLRLTEHDGGAVSSREYLEAGRRVICTADTPYATRVRHDDLTGIIIALRRALRETEPDYEAAAYYHAFNSAERFKADLGAVL
jgi:hypothetical protein